MSRQGMQRTEVHGKKRALCKPEQRQYESGAPMGQAHWPPDHVKQINAYSTQMSKSYLKTKPGGLTFGASRCFKTIRQARKTANGIPAARDPAPSRGVQRAAGALQYAATPATADCVIALSPSDSSVLQSSPACWGAP